jgi:periplasmic divalent cation tolerance protein
MTPRQAVNPRPTWVAARYFRDMAEDVRASYVQVTTVIDQQEAAERIARVVVEERLAACAQVGAPVTSTYHWQGAVETATEYPITCKTPARRAEALTARIVELHGYDVPEILVTPIIGGHQPYLAWLDAETRS